MTEQEYLEEVELSKRLGFEGNYLATTPYDVANRLCNGIGAEWQGKTITKLLNALNPTLKPVADNHDMACYFSDGTEEQFREGNLNFEVNGIKAANNAYDWWNPMRYYVRFKAKEFRRALDVGGWYAYRVAYKQRIKDMRDE